MTTAINNHPINNQGNSLRTDYIAGHRFPYTLISLLIKPWSVETLEAAASNDNSTPPGNTHVLMLRSRTLCMRRRSVTTTSSMSGRGGGRGWYYKQKYGGGVSRNRQQPEQQSKHWRCDLCKHVALLSCISASVWCISAAADWHDIALMVKLDDDMYVAQMIHHGMRHARR